MGKDKQVENTTPTTGAPTEAGSDLDMPDRQAVILEILESLASKPDGYVGGEPLSPSELSDFLHAVSRIDGDNIIAKKFNPETYDYVAATFLLARALIGGAEGQLEGESADDYIARIASDEQPPVKTYAKIALEINDTLSTKKPVAIRNATRMLKAVHSSEQNLSKEG